MVIGVLDMVIGVEEAVYKTTKQIIQIIIAGAQTGGSSAPSQITTEPNLAW